jgi:hypothetical protein
LSQFRSRSVAYNSGSDDSVAAAAATVKVITLRHYSRFFTSNGPHSHFFKSSMFIYVSSWCAINHEVIVFFAAGLPPQASGGAFQKL